MTVPDFVIRILIAIFCGFLIGLERQLTGNVAGIRTNILVCSGTSMFVLFSFIMDAPDVTRIAAQIVTGVGFLCSGIIFRKGDSSVMGLDTAATIWCTAAIGVLSSSGNVAYALCATGLLLFSNIFFRLLGDRVHPLKSFVAGENQYRLSLVCSKEHVPGICAMVVGMIADTGLTLMGLERKGTLDEKAVLKFILVCSGERQDDQVRLLAERLGLEEAVTKAAWRLVQKTHASSGRVQMLHQKEK